MANISSTEVLKNIDWPNLVGGIPGIGDLVLIGKAVGIVVIVYLVFLIIRSVTQILYSRRFGKMAKNVEQINQKMDVLISKLGKDSVKKEVSSFKTENSKLGQRKKQVYLKSI